MSIGNEKQLLVIAQTIQDLNGQIGKLVEVTKSISQILESHGHRIVELETQVKIV